MANYDYSPLADRALALLTKYGRTVTLRNYSGGTYDPVNDVESGETTTDASVKAVIITAGGDTRASGGNANEQRRIAYLPNTVTPSLSSKIIDGSDTYTVTGINEVNPGTLNMLYECTVAL